MTILHIYAYKNANAAAYSINYMAECGTEKEKNTIFVIQPTMRL